MEIICGAFGSSGSDAQRFCMAHLPSATTNGSLKMCRGVVFEVNTTIVIMDVPGPLDLGLACGGTAGNCAQSSGVVIPSAVRSGGIIWSLRSRPSTICG